MRCRHTKTDGDAGVACVIADLVEHGIGVALPLSEHMPFDRVAVSPDGQPSRVSVKFRRTKGGGICVPFRSSWNDRKGTHNCYYVRRDRIAGTSRSLRVGETADRQRERVRFAHEYVDPWAIFPRPVSAAARAPQPPPASAPTTRAPGRGGRSTRAPAGRRRG